MPQCLNMLRIASESFPLCCSVTYGRRSPQTQGRPPDREELQQRIWEYAASEAGKAATAQQRPPLKALTPPLYASPRLGDARMQTPSQNFVSPSTRQRIPAGVAENRAACIPSGSQQSTSATNPRVAPACQMNHRNPSSASDGNLHKQWCATKSSTNLEYLAHSLLGKQPFILFTNLLSSRLHIACSQLS